METQPDDVAYRCFCVSKRTSESIYIDARSEESDCAPVVMVLVLSGLSLPGAMSFGFSIFNN